MTLLKEIFAHKRIEVEMQKRRVPLNDLLRQIDSSRAPLDFIAALKRAPHPPALIAEVKMKSPSKGLLAANFDPITLAITYAANGASAISVLTDEKYFGGSLAHLNQIAKLNLGVPLLRKEFICDEYQIYEARANGASAVLLIVAALSDDKLRSFKHLICELGMSALVEVHTRSELDRALNCGATLIGINNRNLHTFNVSLDVTRTLRPHIPSHITIVAESGIRSREDISDSDVDAMLVGETIVRAGDVVKKTKELAGLKELKEMSFRGESRAERDAFRAQSRDATRNLSD